MACPREVASGDNIVISVTTHSTSGTSSDADTAPIWRLYEDETGTPITTGTMAKVDDANTLGFYADLISVTEGGGFEEGKSYNAHIKAIVDGGTAVTTDRFKVVNESWGGIAIDDNYVWTVATHDPDTSVSTDADSAPTWRLYEGTTDTAILTGTMAKLDDANTTGFYSESVAVTAANGFEAGKTYTVYTTATVDSDAGAYACSFQCVSTDAPDFPDAANVRTNDTVNGTTGSYSATGGGKKGSVFLFRR